MKYKLGGLTNEKSESNFLFNSNFIKYKGGIIAHEFKFTKTRIRQNITNTFIIL